MAKRIYVANLEWSITDDQLANFFGEIGPVVYAKVIIDRDTNRSRGFGFVEYETDEMAAQAIEKFNGVAFNKRNILVKEANPISDRR